MGTRTEQLKYYSVYPRVLRASVVCVLSVFSVLSVSGCLVLSLHPAYDDESLAWDAGLIGTWRDAEDNALVRIEAAEWRSYRVHYEHPIEKGDLTGFLTILGDAHYLDVMPARGEDRGSLLIPVHALLRVDLAGDSLELTALSYDWFADRLRAGQSTIGKIAAVFDQKQNALIVSPTPRVRAWVRGQLKDSAVWGAPAKFTRVKQERP